MQVTIVVSCCIRMAASNASGVGLCKAEPMADDNSMETTPEVAAEHNNVNSELTQQQQQNGSVDNIVDVDEHAAQG